MHFIPESLLLQFNIRIEINKSTKNVTRKLYTYSEQQKIKCLLENLKNTTESDEEKKICKEFNSYLQLSISFRIVFQVFTKKKLADVLYCLLLRFPNFEKGT